MSGSRGFAYVFLLVAVAIIAGAGANALSYGSTTERRAAEQELIAIGLSFELALNSYAGYRAGRPSFPAPNAAGLQGPASLDDLLLDPRAPNPRRHLRKIYADPITGKPDWGLVRNDAGRIVGIHSRSASEPIKKSGFPPSLTDFEQAKTHQDWIFGLPEARLIALKTRTEQNVSMPGQPKLGN